MIVSEFIEWLKTQPQEAVVLVLRSEHKTNRHALWTDIHVEVFNAAHHCEIVTSENGTMCVKLGNDDSQ